MTQFFYDFSDLNSGPSSNPPLGWKMSQWGNSSTSFYHQREKAADGGFFDIAGRLPTWSSGDYALFFLMEHESIIASDIDVLVKYQEILDTGTSYTNSYLGVQVRAIAGTGAYTDYYELQLAGPAGSDGSYIRKVQGGTTSNLSGSSGTGGITRVSQKICWTRFRAAGSTLTIRSWQDGTAEPSTWPHTVTDSSITAAGKLTLGITGMGKLPPSFRMNRIFQIGIGTNTDVAPSAPLITGRGVSGQVTTPTGAIAAGYLVRCYSRKSDVLLAEGLTNASGNYSLSVNYGGQVYVLAVDQLGNTWNVPIKDLITPAPL